MALPNSDKLKAQLAALMANQQAETNRPTATVHDFSVDDEEEDLVEDGELVEEESDLNAEDLKTDRVDRFKVEEDEDEEEPHPRLAEYTAWNENIAPNTCGKDYLSFWGWLAIEEEKEERITKFKNSKKLNPTEKAAEEAWDKREKALAEVTLKVKKLKDETDALIEDIETGDVDFAPKKGRKKIAPVDQLKPLPQTGHNGLAALLTDGVNELVKLHHEQQEAMEVFKDRKADIMNMLKKHTPNLDAIKATVALRVKKTPSERGAFIEELVSLNKDVGV